MNALRGEIIGLIVGRELRDQWRDRRTLFLIFGLPVLMYPLFVGVGLIFWTALQDKRYVIGVVGADYLPAGAAPLGIVTGMPAEVVYTRRVYPPLIQGGRFLPRYLKVGQNGEGDLQLIFLREANEELLTDRVVDAILVIEVDCAARLEAGDRPSMRIIARDGEENSKLAVLRLADVLERWVADVKRVRFTRQGLPPDFDEPLIIHNPLTDKPLERQVFDELRDMLVKVVPFLLVMWMLTGAIYPAIDMTAGEKERGTMETLLISPAERSEIVVGKFLSVAVMGYATALWNVLLMIAAALVAQRYFPHELLSLPGLFAGMVTAIPLALVIAAATLALGVFARSTREGNYYMVPLFLVLLPLAYWSMTPGNELNGWTAWLPVVNVLLLQQRLLAVRPDPFPWHALPGLVVSLMILLVLLLAAALLQFHRESVLFRDAQVPPRRWFFVRRTTDY
ncbi:MAG: ABC transporter permease subunit [Gemmataceae bacterium]|nr:ABC transporter permease subunit [Gemmataceae bacterium]MDW8241803.1 ABC transporter permease subunit [Thermogemmata sp.]